MLVVYVWEESGFRSEACPCELDPKAAEPPVTPSKRKAQDLDEIPSAEKGPRPITPGKSPGEASHDAADVHEDPKDNKKGKKRKNYDAIAAQNKIVEKINGELHRSLTESLDKAVADGVAVIEKVLTQFPDKQDEDFFLPYVTTIEDRKDLTSLVISSTENAPHELQMKIEQRQDAPIVDEMDKLTTIRFAVQRLTAQVRASADEDAIKLAQKEVKDTVAMFKRLLAALNRANSDLKKAMEQKQKKSQGQVEKQRKQAEAQRKKEAKELQKQIKSSAKGQQSDLPCLLMDLKIMQDLVMELPVFADLASVQAEFKAGGSLHEGSVFVVKNAASMKAEVESSAAVKGFMQIFETQFPMSRQAKERQRAQSSMKVDGSNKLKETMLSYCSSQCACFTNEANLDLKDISAYGFTPAMRYSGSEFMGMSTVRYALKGEREIIVCSATRLWKALHQSSVDAGALSTSRPVTTALAETVWQSRFEDQWIQDLMRQGQADGNAKVFYRGVVPENSMLFLPAGVILCERALNNKVAIGLRLSVKDSSPTATSNLQTLLNVHRTYAEEGCNVAARWRDALGQDALAVGA